MLGDQESDRGGLVSGQVVEDVSGGVSALGDTASHGCGWIAGEKVVITVDLHGNKSAASVPLALTAAAADGRIKKGDLVLLEAMGGGLTWGACVVRL